MNKAKSPEFDELKQHDNQGDAEAQNDLGGHYCGNGVAQDVNEAAESYRKAADDDFPAKVFSVEVDDGVNIYYKTTSCETLEVIAMDIDYDDEYYIVIPSTVSYNNTTYAVTGIEGEAFEGCDYLTPIEIPSSMMSIGDDASCDCKRLVSIKIPSSVTSIGMSAFEGCSSLTSITSLNPEPPTCGSDCFADVDRDTCILYVPNGSKSAYSKADEWEDFFNIEEMEVNGIDGVATDGVGGGLQWNYK